VTCHFYFLKGFHVANEEAEQIPSSTINDHVTLEETCPIKRVTGGHWEIAIRFKAEAKIRSVNIQIE
jgi:hypothetical protein